MNDDLKDRRKLARIQLDTSVRISLPGVIERREHFIQNVSRGGLFIRTEQIKPIGTKLRFEFSVRDGGTPIAGLGIVCWIENGEGKARGMGIKFIELNEEGRHEIGKIAASFKK